MKKVALLSLVFFSLLACTQDVTTNSPSLQGMKDDVLWRARDRFAELSQDGSITISGLTRYEALTIALPSSNIGTYIVGQSDSQKATYVFDKDDVTMIFDTGVNRGDGQVIIEEYNTQTQTISGSFRFNLINTETDSVVNYQYGIFYRVPVVPAL